MMKVAPRMPKVFIEDNNWGFYQIWAGGYDVPGLAFESPPTILDLGANIGLASLYFEARYPGCTIHAYEPNPLNFAALKINTRGNPKVHHVQKGVRDVSGTFKLYRGALGHYSDSFYQVEGETTAEFDMVEAISARDLPPCDVMKLDTEGCELEILSTYQHLRHVKAVMLEWHSREDHEKLLHLLTMQRFTILSDEATCYIRGDLVAWRQS